MNQKVGYVAASIEVKYRMKIIETILSALLSQEIATLCRPSLETAMEISLFPLDSSQKESQADELTELVNSIFSILLNIHYVEKYISPVIKKIYMLEDIEDLILLSKQIHQDQFYFRKIEKIESLS